MVRVLKLFPGSVSSCVKLLNEGNLIAIAPGGVREGKLSNCFKTKSKKLNFYYILC